MMPTDEPVTPTHEEMLLLAEHLTDEGGAVLVKYIAASESTTADLLKARERIAELKREVAELKSGRVSFARQPNHPTTCECPRCHP